MLIVDGLDNPFNAWVILHYNDYDAEEEMMLTF